MKDFSEWLNDLTGELQEADHSWIAHAMPEPCGVCGSTEDVCECEEASYHLEDAWAEDLARKLHQHHGGLCDGLGAHTHEIRETNTIAPLTLEGVMEARQKCADYIRKAELAQQIEQSSILWDQYRRRRNDDEI